MSHDRDRRGFNAVEVIIVVVIVSFFVLGFLFLLPRRREAARNAACQRNLMQIGVALVLYDRMSGHLPGVPALGAPAAADSPLKAMAETLGLPDFAGLDSPSAPPPARPEFTVRERTVPGWICPSDTNAAGGVFPAPVNYRATTGDAHDGRGGGFAPGRRISLADVEAGDGTAYTAAYSERLAGTNRPVPAAANYAEVPGPITDAGCPAAPAAAWQGDAGSSWMAADWRSTLYNHARPPNASPSCIAGDRRTAIMGASSSHPGTVNVLTFEGAVRQVTSSVDPRIWGQLATIAPPRPPRRRRAHDRALRSRPELLEPARVRERERHQVLRQELAQPPL